MQYLIDLHDAAQGLTGHAGLEQDADRSAVPVRVTHFTFYLSLSRVPRHVLTYEFLRFLAGVHVVHVNDHLIIVRVVASASKASDPSLHHRGENDTVFIKITLDRKL